MSRPNFFCDIDAMNTLIHMDFENGYEDIDLTVDLIELPYLFIYISDEENWTLKVISRNPFYSHDGSGFEKGALTVNKASGEGSVKADRELAENMPAFFTACRKLSHYIQDRGLQTLYDGLDPEKAGILVTADGDDVSCKVVSGKERPDLMCENLFGAPTMGRPYEEDMMRQFAMESMSFEEKLEAAENGDEDACYEVAMAYLKGDEDEGVEADAEKAVYWYERSAEAGNATAAFNMGQFCAKGFGTQRDLKKAIEWMEKADALGDKDAAESAKNYRQADADLEAAAAGDPEAQGRLAGFYMTMGKMLGVAGSADDYAEALKWARLAAEQNSGEGMWVLALAYEHGRGVAKNESISVEYYQQGAEIGHASCMHSLGCFYLRGDVVEQDYRLGYELVLRAALLGNGLGMRDVGRCCQFGYGCMGNMKKAVAWYKKALEVIEDDELERKASTFERMLGIDESIEEDYYGEDSDSDLSAEAQGLLDVIDAVLSDEVKALLGDPDAVIAPYLKAINEAKALRDEEDDNDEDDENNEDEDDGDGFILPPGMMEAMEAFEAAETYETELQQQGILPDAPLPDNDVLSLSVDMFPRIALMAEKGDRKALEIIAQMDAANEIE